MSREPVMVTDVLVGMKAGLKEAGGREGLGLCRGSLCHQRPPQLSLRSNSQCCGCRFYHNRRP